MDSLAGALERFNRKERNLLIRAILGHKEKPLRLSDTFREQVTEELALPKTIPADAWWGTDYHINWLAGALAIFMKGEAALEVFPNSGLIEGNQEDVDLVIATEDHLVLIEAKANRGFERVQLASKLDRLNQLYEFYQKLADKSRRRISFSLLLLSPERPELDVPWPTWACKNSTDPSKIPWINLPLGDAPPSVLEVTRCDESGKRTAKGTFWRYRKYKSKVPQALRIKGLRRLGAPRA